MEKAGGLLAHLVSTVVYGMSSSKALAVVTTVLCVCEGLNVKVITIYRHQVKTIFQQNSS